jgi:hypothetical protein
MPPLPNLHRRKHDVMPAAATSISSDANDELTVRLCELGKRILAAAAAAVDPARDARTFELMDLVKLEFDGLPAGTAVAVDYATGRSMTGATKLDVLRRATAEYGSAARGLLFEVGREVRIGACR